MNCRGCLSPDLHLVIDLGPQPIANELVDSVDAAEMIYPLRVFVCERCFLMQIPPVAADCFHADYAYFSSANPSLVENARLYVAGVMERFSPKYVLEIASNDGYLLQHFPEGVETHGIEPSANVAEAAIERGINTTVAFFGSTVAVQVAGADLIIANNVLAHVPDLHDFVEGLKIALAPGGVISIEFPHVLNLLAQTQFDTIYHEHYSYLSLNALDPVFHAHGLSVMDVEQIDTHGGSLRLWVTHDDGKPGSTRMQAVSIAESRAGLGKIATYDAFALRTRTIRDETIRLFQSFRQTGNTVAGYGAPAKAATFLNYCGIRADQLPYTIDDAPAKSGKYMPGVRIPIVSPEQLTFAEQPDYLVILPWNWADDIKRRAREFGYRGSFVTLIPQIEITG